MQKDVKCRRMYSAEGCKVQKDVHTVALELGILKEKQECSEDGLLTACRIART